MALSIKIGTGSNIYTDVAQAFANRGNQKLSIVGTGTEIYTARAALTAAAAGIGNIKATSDVTMTALEAETNKAAILKLGTKSLIVSDTAANIGTRFTALDAVYNKTKSLVSTSGVVDITADQLTLATNLNGVESLVGRGPFTVTVADATDFNDNLSALVANASKISSIAMAAGTGTVNAAQLGILGGKMAANSTLVLSDTADNILSSGALANYTANAAKVATINITKATLAQVNHIDTLITATTLADAKMGDTVIQDTAANLNSATLGTRINTASGWHTNAGTVSKIIIDGTGQGAITKATLDGIYGQATTTAFGAATGADAGSLTFLGKAVDIEKSLTALVDNMGTAVVAGTSGPVANITVADGSVAAKKQFTVTKAQFDALNAAFTAGQASSTNTNYGYIVTGALSANAATLQANAKISSFTVTGLAAADANTTAKLTTLLGYSKLKTATIATGYTVSQLATTRDKVSAVASNVDRAKLKYIV